MIDFCSSGGVVQVTEFRGQKSSGFYEEVENRRSERLTIGRVQVKGFWLGEDYPKVTIFD